MEKKGLCCTCINDKECMFTKKVAVLQCEEFSDYEEKSKGKRKSVKKGKVK
ncbi:MAG: hypothetical protein WC955_00180 [Elusimicrobiota bacterium]